ncbi:MAG: phospholipase D family protein [Desulfatitalea sp.]|nr:phospholipase D family protein [Desulfatitalea sp.]NNJ99052.1 phospholipase D family protein [Desulfatitalea sp.]
MQIKRYFSILTAVLIILATGCATLPYPPPPVPAVQALPPAEHGRAAALSKRFADLHPADISGFLALPESAEAFNWRLALADEATASIDVQYFIWQDDETGLLLFDRLLNAADRGVRVRFLVDDMVFAPTGRSIASICRHPNFEIKIFNPVRVRSKVGGVVEFLTNMDELNRRMHNKLFVVDNRVAIVGGRNIGNEYFGLGKTYNFRDLDVLVVGQVVAELSEAFDTFWNSDLSYPGSAMSEKGSAEQLEAIREQTVAFLADHRATLAAYPLAPRDWQQKFQRLSGALMPGRAYFIQDAPVRIGQDAYRLTEMLDYMAEPSRDELVFVSPYLIPSAKMLEELAETTAKGVKVTFVAPAMGANNHTAAHSHYKKYRRRLLAAGAELYEMKHQPCEAFRSTIDVPPVTARFICLHVKAIVGDRERCFVGSLNLDPRAVDLNTENGLYIESPGLCGQLADQFDDIMSPDNAWRVYLNAEDQLRWESSDGTVSRQPARGFGQRISDFFYRLLPLESQL